MSEFTTWYCPKHGPNFLHLAYVYEAQRDYDAPWLTGIDEEGTLTFAYGDSDWEETGSDGYWVLSCNEGHAGTPPLSPCFWQQKRDISEVSTDARWS